MENIFVMKYVGLITVPTGNHHQTVLVAVKPASYLTHNNEIQAKLAI